MTNTPYAGSLVETSQYIAAGFEIHRSGREGSSKEHDFTFTSGSVSLTESGEPVDLAWTKSTYCADKACVEVALINVETVGVRDGKDVSRPHLEFSRAEWTSFLDDVANGSLEVR